ncbi:hypothetical protein [Bifidobacterium platyrrhinorum]|uniref:Uncharacterized protein n=1 Tax=Bifidobacterium platyrrhinorum TaxID=2661628 RepID=A0A6L9SQ66_9BIFI|nr:hypothetical protein [Bifidobacterium platyrrhinorum]NEG54315.1 hypothetical protein [Bifidobacterium platyrrhinorum]
MDTICIIDGGPPTLHGRRSPTAFGPATLSGGSTTPSPFGALPTPMFEASGCRCHETARAGRQRIIDLAATTATVTDTARTALAASRGIDWEGNAALLFRDRLTSIRAALDAHDGDAAATVRIV